MTKPREKGRLCLNDERQTSLGDKMDEDLVRPETRLRYIEVWLAKLVCTAVDLECSRIGRWLRPRQLKEDISKLKPRWLLDST